jgi:hypothetical protein
MTLNLTAADLADFADLPDIAGQPVAPNIPPAYAAAAELADAGHHVHLVSEGESVCLAELPCPGTGPACLPATAWSNS